MSDKIQVLGQVADRVWEAGRDRPNELFDEERVGKWPEVRAELVELAAAAVSWILGGDREHAAPAATS